MPHQSAVSGFVRRLTAARSSAVAGLPSSGFFEGSPVATFVIDDKHRVTHLNKACTVMLGVKAESVIGTRNLGRIFYGHDRPVLADLIVDHNDGGRLQTLYQDNCRPSSIIPGAYEAEGFFPAFGEHGRWLFFTAAPLRDSTGRIVGAIETLQDITARKKAEEALLTVKAALNEKLGKAYDQLVQTEKLVSVGQLAAGVAQEINSPVAYVYSNFGTLEKYISNLFGLLSAYQDAEHDINVPTTCARLKNLRTQMDLDFLRQDIPALMRESREGIVKVRKIVKDLKDFSHIDPDPQWLPSDLNQGIETTLNIIGNEIRRKAVLATDFGELPVIQCLAAEINQVVMNLVNNAADAVKPGQGRITIRTGSDAVNVWIDVEDNGRGIPEKDLSRIFDPFYTTKPIGHGTGLGLSICYGTVKKHHGRIKVNTIVGTGTRFRVLLPIEQPVSQATMPAPLM